MLKITKLDRSNPFECGMGVGFKFEAVDNDGVSRLIYVQRIKPLSIGLLNRSQWCYGESHLKPELSKIPKEDLGKRMLRLDCEDACFIEEGVASSVKEFTLDGLFVEKFLPYALVDGGWLPMSFCRNDQVMFFDRNMVSAISRIAKLTNAGQELEEDDFFCRRALSFLDDTYSVSPLISALEGELKGVQDFSQFEEVLAQESLELAKDLKGLCNAKIEIYSLGYRKEAYDYWLTMQGPYQKEADFLMRTAPIVVRQLGKDEKREMARIKKEILRIADEEGLSHACISVVLTLAVLFGKQKSQSEPLRDFARRLIKPTSTYSSELAYNAVSDLKGVLMAAFFNARGRPANFVTLDKGLSASWCVLKPTVEVNPQDISKTMQRHVLNAQSLFPMLVKRDGEKLCQDLLGKASVSKVIFGKGGSFEKD